MPLIIPPVMQYDDEDGAPLAFAEAYFTQTETDVPVPVYQEKALENEHAYPVLADSQGLFPPVFFDPDLGLVRLRIIPTDGDLDNPLIEADPVNWLDANVPISLTFVVQSVDGSAIPVDAKGDLYIPFDCTVQEGVLLADQVGSIEVDIWKAPYADYPPTVDDTITGVTPLVIDTNDNIRDTALDGWTTAISAGDTLRFNVNSCTTITRCTIQLKVVR